MTPYLPDEIVFRLVHRDSYPELRADARRQTVRAVAVLAKPPLVRFIGAVTGWVARLSRAVPVAGPRAPLGVRHGAEADPVVEGLARLGGDEVEALGPAPSVAGDDAVGSTMAVLRRHRVA